MSERELVIKGLDDAYDRKLSRDMLDVGNGIKIAPQEPTGLSIWAGLLKDGYIEPFQVLWAIRPERKGREKWRAARVTLEEGSYYFNLQHPRDSDDFDALSKRKDEELRSVVPDLEESTPF